MILQDVALLAGAVPRSQAYLQAMVKAGLCPGKCILYGKNREEFFRGREDLGEIQSKEAQGREARRYFDISESLLETIETNQLSWEFLPTEDINSEIMTDCLKRISQKYLIYSGYGGGILHSPLFGLGKEFLHVHAGILPLYRGSTTAYFSMLKTGRLGATAIFLNEQIDEGDIIVQEEYPIPEERVNLDYIYEPWIRSRVLCKALRQYAESGLFFRSAQCQGDSESYYIIHPVLKHLALLKAARVWEAGE